MDLETVVASPTTMVNLNPRQIRELRWLGRDVDQMGRVTEVDGGSGSGSGSEGGSEGDTGETREAQLFVEYVFSVALASEPGNPSGFKQAMSSPDKEFWMDGMKTEFENCEKRKVYILVPRDSVPRGKKILKLSLIHI